MLGIPVFVVLADCNVLSRQEPPYTEPYLRWRERTAGGNTVSYSIDYFSRDSRLSSPKKLGASHWYHG